MTKRVRPLNRQQLWIISLLLAVVFVIFILPKIVTLPLVSVANENFDTPTPVNIEALTPSEIAEKTRYRQQSQSLLALILVLRDKLLGQSIDQWAQAQYNNAMELVAEGDEQYSYGKYQQSLDSYNLAFEKLQELEKLATDTLEQSLNEGAKAIERADVEDIALVRGAVSLATAIAPEDDRVKKLNLRAINFSDVVDAISQGDIAFTQEQYQLAKDYYESALAIISDHQRTQESIGKTKIAIDNNNFVKLMSHGYSALDNSDYVVALEKFTQAQAIYDKNASTDRAQSERAIEKLKSVEQAISQLNNQRSLQAIKQQLSVATDFEKKEQWQQAQTIYQRLLDRDSSLIDVKARLLRATIRAKLDQQIVSVLNDPLKLADQSAYSNAQKTLSDAQGIKNPQAKLRAQIEQLTSLVQRARMPVEILLVSDQQTEVTVYRVAKLGAFQEMRVQLVPGRYIIAGSRKGYRDVRIELVVEGIDEIPPLQISCTERI